MKILIALLLIVPMVCTAHNNTRQNKKVGYERLAPNENYTPFDIVLINKERESYVATPNTSYTGEQSAREETVNRYYSNLFLRAPTAIEQQFGMYILWAYDCGANGLGTLFQYLTTQLEFKNSLPPKYQVWPRAQDLVSRMYYAALNRAPDAGGYAFYTTALATSQLSETNFIAQIVGSQEFESHAGEWCQL